MNRKRLTSSTSEDVLIMTDISTLVIRLHKTSSRRLQDILIKTNVFVLVIRLQDVFKTFSKRLQNIFKTSCKNVFKTSSRRLQDILEDIFKTSLRRFHKVLVFRTFLGRYAKTIIYRKICLGHSCKNFLVRVQNFQEWTLWIYWNFQSSFLKHILRWLGIIVKPGIRKDVAVSANKKSLNKSGSKIHFSGFSFSLYYIS